MRVIHPTDTGFFLFSFQRMLFFENQKIDSIRRWMDEHYCDMVPATFPSLQEKSNNDPVWIFWYQGETAMPEIVKYVTIVLSRIYMTGQSIY